MPIAPTSVYGPGLYGTSSFASAGESPVGRVQAEPSGGENFAATITRLIDDANREQIDAAQKVSDLLVHGKGTIHDAMIAVDNAEGSFRLLMEMRNRMIEGVNRLLETQV